jgi:hypothetical protein
MAKWQFRRSNAKQQVRRDPPSQFECGVWRNRPYNCHSWPEALEHHRRTDEKFAAQREQLDQIKNQAKRKRDWEAIPEWCYRDEHPLKMGRKGRMYHKSDLVGPIIDSMRALYDGKTDDVFGVFTQMDANKKKRRKKDGYDEAEEKEQARIERERLLRVDPQAKREAYQKALTAPAWECACCGNTDVKTQVQHKDALLCPCGFVVRLGGEIISTHREKLGAEESEDKTQHADKPHEKRVQWYDSDYVPTVHERRNERKYSAQVTKIGGRAGGKLKLGRLCDVQRMADEASAKEWRAADVANGSKLAPKDETKGWNIIAEINRLTRELAPVEHEVKRVLRKEADAVWHRAVRHCRTCTRTECCELRLIERTPAIIAASVFETSIERMLHDESEDGPRVTRQHLLDVQMRMQRSQSFSNSPAITQMNTAKAMINILAASDFDPDIICAPSLPKPNNYLGEGAILKPARSAPFSRNDSTISCGGNSPPPTEAVVLRDAVSTVFLAHRSELPAAVRDGALRAVQTKGFLEACRGIEDLKPYSLQCMAFCILNAVRREQTAQEPGPSFVSGSEVDNAFNVGIAMKLPLDLAVAEDAIVFIRGLVPTDATSEASHNDDDDLFS